MEHKTLEGLFHKAVSIHEKGDLVKASELYEEILHHIPDSPLVNYNYGLVLFELKKYEKSSHYYLKASEAVPNNSDILYNLALCYQKIARYSDSIEIYKKILGFPEEQHSTDVLYNLGCCYKDSGDFVEAINTFLEVLKLDPNHESSCNNVAYLYHKDEKFEEAEFFYTKLLEINPNHLSAKYMLGSIQGDYFSSAPSQYVEQVFDEYSVNYEKSLIGDLKYSVPTTMRKQFEELFDIVPKSLIGLDLGCGTGLSGLEFAGFCSSLTGVDLSGKMIEEAVKKNIYTSLHKTDIVSFFKDKAQNYSLILAADVFTYIGELQEIFTYIFEYSLPNSIFCFSVEKTESSHFQLKTTGRFGHSEEYILKTTSEIGWRKAHSSSTNLRLERGKWIEGKIYYLLKN